ncbi:hypothetical protein [Campylobacter sp. RM16187]|uniref:hypothetical protein n=1 Tax=Campylobacter sp. RM16187 TaxID=1660063 RepID=UPI0021B6D4E4|nr:hypothetical protein [Campylobacter sp. RM16187]
MAIRGTDVALNRPVNTIEDLYNDFQLALAGVNLQEISLESYYNKLVSQGIISTNEKITVVGHSLGGYLAQILTIKHPEVVDHTYTFNAPGIGGLPGTLLNALSIENIHNPKITDIVAKDGLSLIAGTGLNAGQEIEVSGESHSSVDLTKIFYFYDNMIKNGTSEEVTSYLSGLHKSSKAIFKGGVDDIAEQTMQKIDKIINKAINKTDIIDICQAYENSTNNINFNIQLINPDSTIPNSNSSIENLYALINLNPFIGSGISSKAYTELEKHKDEYSDEYVQDCKLAS